jgi:intein/homing endonuclease
MELLGWIISEGSFVKKRNYKRVLIHQSSKAKPENYLRIRNLLARLGLETREYERSLSFKDDQMFEELSVLGKSHERFIPQEYKNQSVLLLSRLLESLLLGDGERNSGGGGHTYTTTSSRLAKDVHEIALKCGMEASIREREPKTFISPNGKQYTRRKQYRVSITDNRPMLYPEPSREEYEGEIVCVQVADNHTLFTRYEGRAAWVGNCNQRSEATWSYFDPAFPLYGIYQPKPWKIETLNWATEGNMEVVLRKREEKRDA